MLTQMHTPTSMPMRVVALMSGSGTNVRKLLEHEKALEASEGFSPFKIAGIFSDNPESNAVAIADEYRLPRLIRDYKAFREQHTDMDKWEVRSEFDRQTVAKLNSWGATVAAYCGYMLVATGPLINAFTGVNVHPADLSIEKNGARAYTGDKAVYAAIKAGEKVLRSSTHIIDQVVDQGKILMRSDGLAVDYPEDLEHESLEEIARTIAPGHQDTLKEIGDWVIFPKTIEYLAQGRFAKDGNGNVYFDKKPIPKGVCVGDTE